MLLVEKVILILVKITIMAMQAVFEIHLTRCLFEIEVGHNAGGGGVDDHDDKFDDYHHGSAGGV